MASKQSQKREREDVPASKSGASDSAAKCSKTGKNHLDNDYTCTTPSSPSHPANHQQMPTSVDSGPVTTIEQCENSLSREPQESLIANLKIVQKDRLQAILQSDRGHRSSSEQTLAPLPSETTDPELNKLQDMYLQAQAEMAEIQRKILRTQVEITNRKRAMALQEELQHLKDAEGPLAEQIFRMELAYRELQSGTAIAKQQLDGLNEKRRGM